MNETRRFRLRTRDLNLIPLNMFSMYGANHKVSIDKSCSRLVNSLAGLGGVGEPFPGYALKCFLRPFFVADAVRDPVVIPEVEFRKVAVQMLLAQCWYTPFTPRLKIEK